jgi:PST family polysaccharide transporter
MLLYNTHGWIHLSIGRADRWLRWGIVELTVTGLCFLIGLSWGPVGIAVAWVVSFWILTIPALWYAGRPVSLQVGPMIAVVWRYVLASALAAIASDVVVRELPSVLAAPGVTGALARIAVKASLFGVFYLAGVILLHMGCEPLRRIAELLEDMIPSRRVHQGPAVIVGPASADGV